MGRTDAAPDCPHARWHRPDRRGHSPAHYAGRADSCDIILPHDGEVSREHAQVWLDDRGQVLVADKGSKNGTRVDAGDPFHNTVRPAQRSIRIGEYELEIAGPQPYVLHESQVRFQPETAADPDNTHFFPSTRALDLSQQRLALLISLTERIGGTFAPKQLLEQALDACCEALGFERGLIALKTRAASPSCRSRAMSSATRPAPSKSAARSSTAPSSRASGPSSTTPRST